MIVVENSKQYLEQNDRPHETQRPNSLTCRKPDSKKLREKLSAKIAE